MERGASGGTAARGGRRRGGLVCSAAARFATATTTVFLLAGSARADTKTRVDADALVGWGLADLEHHRPTSGLGVGGRFGVGWCTSCMGPVFLWGGPFVSFLHVVGDNRDSGDAFAGGVQAGIFLGERENEPVFGFRGGLGVGYGWQHLDAPSEKGSEEGLAFHYHAELVYQQPIGSAVMAEFGLSGTVEFVGGDNKRTDAVGIVGALIGLTFRP